MTLKSLLTLYSNTLQYWYMALYCIVLLHGNARQCMALKVHHSSACTVVLCTACASLEWSSAAQRSESHAVWETAPVANYFICPGGLSWIQQEEVVRIYIAAGENAESWRNTSFCRGLWRIPHPKTSPSPCSQLLPLPRRTVNCMLAARGNQVFC